MTKQAILDYFKDINEVYNDSGRHDSLSRMLDALLEKQEPVEPIIGEAEDMPGFVWYVCPACKISIDCLDNYCRHCGRQMKWD